MIYPDTFEAKTGFGEIRALLLGLCMSQMGRERVDEMAFMTDSASVNRRMDEVREFRRLQEQSADIPLEYFIDGRAAIGRLRIEGTHLEAEELFDARRSLETICKLKAFLCDDRRAAAYPALHRLTEGIGTFPDIVRLIDTVIDKDGNIRDDASPSLGAIRRERRHTEGSISRTLRGILHAAQSEGLVEKDTAPAMRDGRLVIPVVPALKRKIRGIVHDESASGKTVYIEPAEVVEANNRIRELESDERREITRILNDTAASIRPHAGEIVASYSLLAAVDFIRAKAQLARLLGAYEPVVKAEPLIDWAQARHPLLQLSLDKQGKHVVPLDIALTSDRRILIISGPNAGGKSVCLKTVGLLQYMLQCGLPIPVGDHSAVGMFESIMIDIGDEQSIQNDLSTYSGHLLNMKMMMRRSDASTLLLIDEMGAGTEPQIGGAIAQSVLHKLCDKGAYGIITTHYQNLKHFADTHDGVVNGAMLYDRNEMRPLFQLAIGQPGSSFAVDMARKTGLPEDVIREASDIVGSDYIQSDRYLQDIARDKRYWESKRKEIHFKEKRLQDAIDRYERSATQIEQERKAIVAKAKEQAEELLRESNRRIENTIREIKESQAEREDTRRIRSELDAFKKEVETIDTQVADEQIERKMRQIERRRERKRQKAERRKAGVAATTGSSPAATLAAENGQDTSNDAPIINTGDSVRIKGLTAIGIVERVNGSSASVIFGSMRTKMPVSRLEKARPSPANSISGASGLGISPIGSSHTPAAEIEDSAATTDLAHPHYAASHPAGSAAVSPYMAASRSTREAIDSRRLNFKPDIDVRGMRGDEALTAVKYFIDDAILVGSNRVRILHGTGAGILRKLIRQYLNTVPGVITCRDEHVQFGGAGITVVDLE